MKTVQLLQPDESDEYWTDERCFILELSNDADDPEVSVARARVAPGVTTKRHRVAATAERYVILHGQGEARIGDELPAPVGPGSVVRIPPGVPQSIANTGTDDLVFLCICTPPFQWPQYESLE